MKLNVREIPLVNSSTLIGRIPANAIGIRVRECKYARDGKRWCYIFYPIGARHIEGWVRAYYLAPLDISVTSYVYIRNFLKNFYLAEEENFLDKLKLFYDFPLQRYFNQYGVDYIQLRNSKVDFYKRWFKRRYRLLDVLILKRTRDYIDVKATVDWKLSGSGVFESGRDIQKIRLVFVGDTLKVKAIKNLSHIVFDSKSTIVRDSNETVLSDSFYIKVGSFFSDPNPKFLSDISESGFNYVIKDDIYNGNIIKRVYIGPYSTREEAERFLGIVKSRINKDAYIKSF
jgi:hypothetical protein